MPAEAREHQAGHHGAHGKARRHGAAVEGQVRAAPGRIGVRHDEAGHGRVEQAGAHGLHEPPRQKHPEIGGEQGQAAAQGERSAAYKEHRAQPQAPQQERRERNGRGGHHHVAGHEPVRRRERHAELVRHLRKGDVHHALRERGGERAREEQRELRPRLLAARLQRRPHRTAFPRTARISTTSPSAAGAASARARPQPSRAEAMGARRARTPRPAGPAAGASKAGGALPEQSRRGRRHAAEPLRTCNLEAPALPTRQVAASGTGLPRAGPV